MSFDQESNQENKYVPVLADLPEESHAIIWGTDYFYNEDYFRTDSYKYDAQRYHVYGVFEDVFVMFISTYGNDLHTSETVNGLTFSYNSSTQLTVCFPGGKLSMSDAFDSGILTAEQVQVVYDNYNFLRSTGVYF